MFGSFAADSASFTSSCHSASDVESWTRSSTYLRLLRSFLPILSSPQKPYNAFIISCLAWMLNRDGERLQSCPIFSCSKTSWIGGWLLWLWFSVGCTNHTIAVSNKVGGPYPACLATADHAWQRWRLLYNVWNIGLSGWQASLAFSKIILRFVIWSHALLCAQKLAGLQAISV